MEAYFSIISSVEAMPSLATYNKIGLTAVIFILLLGKFNYYFGYSAGASAKSIAQSSHHLVSLKPSSQPKR